MFIPEPGSEFFPFRILDPNFVCALLAMLGCDVWVGTVPNCESKLAGLEGFINRYTKDTQLATVTD